jgi:hypothetical protein
MVERLQGKLSRIEKMISAYTRTNVTYRIMEFHGLPSKKGLGSALMQNGKVITYA